MEQTQETHGRKDRPSRIVRMPGWWTEEDEATLDVNNPSPEPVVGFTDGIDTYCAEMRASWFVEVPSIGYSGYFAKTDLQLIGYRYQTELCIYDKSLREQLAPIVHLLPTDTSEAAAADTLCGVPEAVNYLQAWIMHNLFPTPQQDYNQFERALAETMSITRKESERTYAYLCALMPMNEHADMLKSGWGWNQAAGSKRLRSTYISLNAEMARAWAMRHIDLETWVAERNDSERGLQLVSEGAIYTPRERSILDATRSIISDASLARACPIFTLALLDGLKYDQQRRNNRARELMQLIVVTLNEWSKAAKHQRQPQWENINWEEV